ncbi:MAG: NAD(P)/FAD-dependent oxidoreductase [Chloroflexota bacterium]
MEKKTVVVLGAGFAGVAVFQELRRLFTAEECEIVVIDENNFSLYTPMLTEAAGGEVDAADIVAPIRALTGVDVRYEQAKVQAIDVEHGLVTVIMGNEEAGIPRDSKEILYDHLVVCVGSITNFHHIPGLKDHALRAKTVSDAIEIRNRSLAVVERAGEEKDPEKRKALLTFVVGGGGFSGIETIAAVNGMVRERVTKGNGGVREQEIAMKVVQPGGRILPEISESLASYTQQELNARGIEVMLDTEVIGAGEDWVEVKGKHDEKGHKIPARTLIWAGGVTPSPVIDTAKLKRGKHGGIVVDSTCAVSGHTNIWSLGDCAEIPIPGKNGKTYAPTAQNASREGKLVAHNIHAALTGGQAEPFVYKPIGELAIIGKRTGVAEIYGFRFKGVVAWILWRAVYLAKLPRMAQRLKVVLDWSLDAIFGHEIAEVPGRRGETMSTERSA